MSACKKLAVIGVVLAVILIVFTAAVNIEIIKSSVPFTYKMLKQDIPQADAVLILGARVYDNGQLSLILQDRTVTALEVYRSGKAKKILVSGDHGHKNYDEVNAVKKYLLDVEKVPAQDIFLDHAGFDTYDSLYRARDIFEVKSLIVPTQNFHLPRAVYIGNRLGIKTYGLSADVRVYRNEKYNELREVFSRVKAWLNITLHSKPKFLGEKIPITGDSTKSWD